MTRSRLPAGLWLAVVAVSLIVVGVRHFASTAAAAQPRVNPQALARAVQVQNRHTDRLMVLSGVAGTATGIDAAGQPVVKVFLEHRGIRGIPARLEGVPLAVEVTGRFVALGQPRQPYPKRPGGRPDRRPSGDRDRPPKVTLTSPEDGATVGDVVTITADATDDRGVQEVDFYIDGALIDEDTDVTDGWSTAWNSTEVADGWHTITAIATDTADKTGSDSIDVAVVNGPSPFLRPALIGVSTGHPDVTAGTIACRVVDADGHVYALSNNHIYANCNRAAIGDNVLQPGPYDGGIDPRDAIGALFDFEPIVFSRRAGNTIDAAVALSSTDLLGNATPRDGYGAPNSSTAPAVVGLNVMKYGRTTGLTRGSVAFINATVTVSYGNAGVARFVGQIVVSPGTFSAGGDSGALVVTDDKDKRPVGLLFAGSTSYTVCNPIDAVLDGLDVTVDGAK